MKPSLLISATIVLAMAEEPMSKIRDWTVSDTVSKMDGVRSVMLFANSTSQEATLVVTCEGRQLRLAFYAKKGIKLDDINCDTLSNGTRGWLGGGRCVNQAFVRWRFEPMGVLASYWLERLDSGQAVRFDTLWKKQLGLIADNDTIRLEVSTFDGRIEEEIQIGGFREVLPKLALAGCPITIKPAKNVKPRK